VKLTTHASFEVFTAVIFQVDVFIAWYLVKQRDTFTFTFTVITLFMTICLLELDSCPLAAGFILTSLTSHASTERLYKFLHK